MGDNKNSNMIKISVDDEMWNRIYTVHSLVIIGSKEPDGSFNMAPKHMAMPMGFSKYFGFIGTPRKSTYRNVEREKVFTVSFPRPDQVVISSLSASRREKDDSKPILKKIPMTDATEIEGKFLENSYFNLECKLSQFLGKFGEWELVIGEVVAACVNEDAIRRESKNFDGAQLVYDSPLLAYLHPDRFSKIRKSNAFPFPEDFKR
ncbi:flavin reductase [Balneolaceae bacterium YR4-1]|uniref:Flavin reductase n=1 Tax=Halalkalibaculum roseum TaxID=2709311 RepID=A0A6M1T474_9BACT|nr:flavin reductase [Halalkalibaculum roseum]NGP77547.1 flavin reductase [Halalkalibaculum roseum]